MSSVAQYCPKIQKNDLGLGFFRFLKESRHYKLGAWRKTGAFTRQTNSNVKCYRVALWEL